MTAPDSAWLKAQRVPSTVQSAVTDIITITDEFCAQHLDAEYAQLCRTLIVTLARKRPSPLLRGDRRIWAAGVVHTVGFVNFVTDPAQTPHLRTEQLADLLQVKQTTMGNKGALIRDLLGIRRFDARFARREMIDKNLMNWIVQIDGLPVDARWLPEAVQRELVQAGLIPYVSEQRGQ